MSANPELEEQVQPPLEIVPKPGDMAGLYARIAAVMAEVERVAKTKSVDGKYQVATGDDLFDMLRPIMGKHQVICIPNMDAIEIIEADGKMKTYRGHFTFTIADGETGFSFQRCWQSESRDLAWSDKVINKVSRIATRYFLSNLFQISTGDPADDGDLSAEQTDQPRQAQSRKEANRINTGANDKPNGWPPASDNGHNTPAVEPPATKSTGSTSKLAFKGMFGKDFDSTKFWQTINPLYDNENHKFNSLNKMWDAGELTADMDAATAIAAVEGHVKQRAVEKENDKPGKGLTADEWETLATTFIDQSEDELLTLLKIEKRQQWKDGLEIAIKTIKHNLTTISFTPEAADD